LITKFAVFGFLLVKMVLWLWFFGEKAYISFLVFVDFVVKMSEVEKRKPDLVIRGNNKTILSIWISERGIRLSVSRRGEQGGFEKIDSYSIPLDYLLYKLVSSEELRPLMKRHCSFVEALVEEEEEKEAKE